MHELRNAILNSSGTLHDRTHRAFTISNERNPINRKRKLLNNACIQWNSKIVMKNVSPC